MRLIVRVPALLLLILSAGCAIAPVVRRDAGVAPSAAAPWIPPANAVPAAPTQPGLTLPDGFRPGMPISLAQIVDLALLNNTTTRTAWLQARAAQAALGSRAAAYLPTVDLSASAARTHIDDSQTSLGASLALTYLLFDFGGREAGVEQARQTLIAADYSHNQAIQDVVLRTQQTYYEYLDAKALLTAQDATVKERQTQLDAANARHNAGIATIADVLQARTALSQAQLTRESIEGNVRAIEGALATVMGLPATTQFEFGDLPLEVPARAITEKVDDLIARAAAQRPELAAARALAERARARVREVRAEGLPAVTLNSSAGRSIYSGGGNSSPYSASLNLRFPLFTGFRNTFDIREAQLDAEIAAENVRAVQQDMDLQVWTTYFALQTAAQRVATSRDLLSSAQQSADVAHERYRSGVGTILDLLTAEAALENARALEVQARTDWLLAVAQLAHATGALNMENTR